MAANESARIYAVIGRINKAEWKTFVRTKLGLSELEIEECEENNSRDLREQRFQMVKRWQITNGRAATIARLEEMADNWKGVTAQTRQTASPAAGVLSVSHHEPPNSVQSASSHIISTPAGDMSSPNWQPFITLGSPGSALQKRRESGASNTGSSGASVIPVQDLKAFTNDSPGQKKKDIGCPPEESGSDVSEVTSKLSPTELHSSAQAVTQDGNEKKSIAKALKRFLGREKKPKKNIESPVQNKRNVCEIVKEVNVSPTSSADYDAAKKTVSYDIKDPKGCVLILNNSFVNNEKHRRYGSEKDVKNMKKLWQKLDCELHREEPQCEKKASEMESLLCEMTQLEKKYSFIVIVIMTHGTTENGDLIFKGVDYKSVKVKEIEKMFNNQKAKNLRDIPKFFIFQFCHGNKLDKGVVSDTFEENVKTTMKNIVWHNQNASNRLDVVAADGGERIPTTSDMLIAYATQAEHAALRHPENGSWFINAITNVFMKDACTDDVESMLTKVHKAMKDMEGMFEKKDRGEVVASHPIKAMSKHETSLTKKLHLFPGRNIK